MSNRIIAGLPSSDANLGGLNESSLQIDYWHEAQQLWVTIPTEVDAAANALTIRLDQLTLFAVLEAPARQPGCICR